ncbi:MAG: hypothetical protein GEU96_13745 [Propionibacteriales bacterium]|nr:hypothetical protein [Propionibacteriales bacterium]
MLIPRATAHGIADGSVTLAFRRWDAPRVRVGGRQRTTVGVVEFVSLDQVDPDALTEADATAAGAASVDRLQRLLSRRTDGQVYRIGVRWAGPDLREALRETLPDAAALAEIDARLDAMDAARRTGPWTRELLRLIASREGVLAAELAAHLGREKLPFKHDVRRLKELGLTHSLAVGYELSPRGRAYLDSLR